MSESKNMNYGEAIRDAFRHLLAEHDNVFAIGQGLWSPWYVGSSMTDLDKEFGRERVMDTPVSELATTSAAVGAALGGYRPIVIHPRLDFMILATDSIVNHAAKWHHMLGGAQSVPVTIRGIVNRGGEQGAQHSQALHSWYAHIPGLRVVMPATPSDARDLLIASVLCDDPVVYIDDRWLYDLSEELPPAADHILTSMGPVIRREGTDLTLVGASFSARQCIEAAESLDQQDISAEVIDLRIINPLDVESVVASVSRTGRLCVVDGGWTSCGLAGEIIAAVSERIPVDAWRCPPKRVTLTDTPAPTSAALEAIYYTTVEEIVAAAASMLTS